MGKTGRKRQERSVQPEYFPEPEPVQSGPWLDDKTLKCADCKETFVFTGKDQKFFQSKGFESPKRCKKCRDLRKAQRGPQGPTPVKE